MMRLPKERISPIRNDWHLVGLKNLAYVRELLRTRVISNIDDPRPGFVFDVLVAEESLPAFLRLKELSERNPDMAQVGPCRFKIEYVGAGAVVNGPEGKAYRITFRVVGNYGSPKT